MKPKFDNNDTELSLSDIYYIKEDMDGREFEKFCVLLFKRTNQYKNVEITPYKCDGGKDIILTKLNNEKIYVECKRYSPRFTTNEDWMIGRVVCQKLIGAMVGEGIHEGVIISTGNVHDNSYKYIRRLHLNNKSIKLNIIEMDEILKMSKNLSRNELMEISKIKSYFYKHEKLKLQ